MSTATQDSDVGDSTALDATARQRARRWVRPTVVVLVVLALAVLVGALTASGPSGYLQPESAEPQGGLALHHLLDQQGVRVVVLSDIRQVAVEAHPGTTVLATDGALLTDDDLQRLALARGDVVVTDPAPEGVPTLVPGMSAGDVVERADP